MPNSFNAPSDNSKGPFQTREDHRLDHDDTSKSDKRAPGDELLSEIEAMIDKKIEEHENWFERFMERLMSEDD